MSVRALFCGLANIEITVIPVDGCSCEFFKAHLCQLLTSLDIKQHDDVMMGGGGLH